jgi:hypothetical protein
MNKRGNIIIPIMVVLVLFLILFIGFMAVIGSSVINYVFDIAVPEVTNLGQVEDVNLTQVADITIVPLNTFIQSFTWLTGVMYFLALVGSIALALLYRSSPNPLFIGFFFMLVVLLVIGSIFMSNIYEDFYNDAGELGDRLREHTLLSFMILYSPSIFTVVSFISGIILFSGRQDENVF